MIYKKISFYISGQDASGFPENIDDCWDWLASKESLGLLGKYHWVLQPYLLLKKYGSINTLRCRGYDCTITSEFPRSGIVIAHPDCLSKITNVNKKLFVVVTLVDRGIERFPLGDYYVVHNPLQTKLIEQPSYFIPPISQINLVPRDARRGGRFENIAFYGYPEQLANELTGDVFSHKLEKMGLNFKIIPAESWNNFSDVDAVIAIRSFDRADLHANKPFLKLVNCWRAGVPAILGSETAYSSIGESEIDYLEANSLEEVFHNLQILKNSPLLRGELVERGKAKSVGFTFEQTAMDWEKFLIKIAIPSYEGRDL